MELDYRGPRFTVYARNNRAASFDRFGWAIRTRYHGWVRGFPASDVIDYLRGPGGWPATAARDLVYRTMRRFRAKYGWRRGTPQSRLRDLSSVA